MKRHLPVWIMPALALLLAHDAPAQTNSAISIPDYAPPGPDLRVPVLPGARTEASKPAARPLSPWANDVAKLARADVGDDVLYSFIDNSGTFNLDADQIIELRRAGVSPEMIVAMIQHDADVTSGIRPLTITTTPSKPATIQFTWVPKASKEQRDSPSSPVATVKGASRATTAASEATAETDPLDSLPDDFPAPPLDGAYRVRQPQPEPVTPPILVFKAASLTPNTLVIEFGP